MKKPFLLLCILLLLQSCSTMRAMADNAHFWRATNFFGEPRYEKAWLSSLDISVGAGSTGSSRDFDNQTADLLNLYGPHCFQKLGEGVSGKDPNNPLDLILINLALQPSRGCFGRMIYDGTFKVTEANFMFTQNFTHGFFGQIQVPVRTMELCDLCRCDISPSDLPCPNRDNIWWQAFLENFDAILRRYCVQINCFKHTNAGDAAFLLGWTTNYEETEVLDFIDITLKSGLLTPTGRERDIRNPFDIPSGYDGHYAIPLFLDTAFGLYEWLNLGFHVNALVFFKTTKTIPMKTSLAQNGFVKLARGRAEIDRGTLWNIGSYLKADHFAHGLSLLVAYSFAQQDQTKLTPCETLFDATIVNNDETLSGFKMHVLNFILEYDFAREDSRWGPRVGFFYNLQVGGKRVFKTNMAGGLFGLDVSWNI